MVLWSEFYDENVLYMSSALMINMAVVTFIACLIISAPYGRYSTDKGWGPLIPSKVAWVLMETPNLWMSALFYFATRNDNRLINSLPNRILLTYFVLHYIHRSIIFPLNMKTQNNPMPVSVMLLAFLFCSWNGFTQALALIVVENYPSNWIYDGRFLFGSLIFAVGMYINISADYELLRLKGLGKGYQIPRGGVFEYVSCANYFGEIVEWFGFAIACWSLPALAFALYTLSNVGPRAYKHHQWYKTKFEDYPKDRYAVIPFIW